MRHNLCLFWRTILAPVVLVILFCTPAAAQFYQKSYALVIGINSYPSPKWKDLNYARKDAESMAALLSAQGFEVIPLYDAQATKTAIISKMQNYLAPRVRSGDRMLLFFAGHGYTEPLGGKDWGYIVPYDGGNESATYISMEELQTQSEKMGSATHQLFIMDACYGGLLTTRSGPDPNLPNYLSEVTKRIARQILTAGGKDQQVLDGGPGGHSVFTGVLLEALREGLADLNGDGYITFTELCSYVVPRASNRFQTPASGILPGHGLGEFVFRSSRQPAQPPPKPVEPTIPDRRGAPEVAPNKNVPTSTHFAPKYELRSTARENFSKDEMKRMLVTRGFFDSYNNKTGKGIPNEFTPQTSRGKKVVWDQATGLMWQQSGLCKYVYYEFALDYIRFLNAQQFAGFSDWRLPTLEEAMSLLEPVKKNGDLFIDAVFDQTQRWIWTSDKVNAGRAWFVSFLDGYCTYFGAGRDNCVRAVRRGQ